MSIPPKQIGWSTESNLLWQVAKGLDKLLNTTGAGVSNIITLLNTKVTNELGVPSFRANTFANLPAPGVVGRMFVATDTFAIYRDNGTGWDLIGGPGTGSITGTGVAGQVTFWNGTSTQSGDSGLNWDSINKILQINTGNSLKFDLYSTASVGNNHLRFANTTGVQGQIGFLGGSTDNMSIINVKNANIVLATNNIIRWNVLGSGILQSNGAQIIQTSTGNLTLATGGGNGNILLTPNGTGNVGIGTTSPSSKLHISETGAGNMFVAIQKADNTNGNTVSLDFVTSSAYVPTLTNFGGRLRYTRLGSNGVGDWDIMSADSIGAPISRFKIFNGGNVLIQNGGTFTDAGYRLDVNGTARIQGNLTTNLTAGRVTFIGTGGVLSDNYKLLYSSTTNSLEIQGLIGALPSLKINNLSAEDNAYMFIDFVGIRTTTSVAVRIRANRRGTLDFMTQDLPSSVDPVLRWSINNTGIFQSEGAQTIRTSTGNLTLATNGGNGNIVLNPNGTGTISITDAKNIALGTTTGTKIGTATSQKLSLWNATPIVQPTTSVAGATIVGGGGTTLTDTDTFDGYTLAQIVRGLRNLGAFA